MKNSRVHAVSQLGRSAKLSAEKDLKVAAQILEWEIGDIWGHVGVRLPDQNGIAVQMFRRPEEMEQRTGWSASTIRSRSFPAWARFRVNRRFIPRS